MSLKEFLDLQDELEKTSYKTNFSKLTLQEKQEETKITVLALFSELNEVLGSINWKPWKKTDQLDVSNLYLEVGDLFHFFLRLCLIWGIDEELLTKLYLNKRAENSKRQLSGY